MTEWFYVCPECGFKQKSNAKKKVKCGRCGRQYKRRTAKQERKKPDDEMGTEFVTFERS